MTNQWREDVKEEYIRDLRKMLADLELADAVINRDGIIFEWSQNWFLSKFDARIVEIVKEMAGEEKKVLDEKLKPDYICGHSQMVEVLAHGQNAHRQDSLDRIKSKFGIVIE